MVDAHLHQWNPRRTPWASNRLSRLYRYVPGLGERVFPMVVPQADREYVLSPTTVARTYEPVQYVSDASDVPAIAGVGIDTVVHVSAHWRGLSGGANDDSTDVSSLEETRYVTSLPFGTGAAPRLGAVVVNADPRSETIGTLLDQHADLTDRLRGIRCVTTRHPDPRVRAVADADGILASSAFLRGFEAVAERGLCFDGYVYSHQLYDVVSLAREYPQTPIIIDHLGTPAGVFGPVGTKTGTTASARADIVRLWRERMVTLAASPNVVVKLSGLALPILGYGRDRWGNIGSRATLTEMIGPLVEHVLIHFGSDRVMFGSNFPIDKPNTSLEMTVGTLIDLLASRGDHALRNVFRDTARRVYRIDD